MSETTHENTHDTAAEAVATEAAAPAKKAPAKKAAAKKAPAKKAAAKKAPAKKAPAKKAAASAADAAEGDAPAKPAKKAAAKKAPAKKAAAPKTNKPKVEEAPAAEIAAEDTVATDETGAPAVLFQAPETPKRTRTRRPAAAKVEETDATDEESADEAAEGVDAAAPEVTDPAEGDDAEAGDETSEDEDADESEETEGQTPNPNRRRRRRGGRRRRKPAGAGGGTAPDGEDAESDDEEAPEGAVAAGSEPDAEAPEGDEDGDGTSTRRRRRRVRAGESGAADSNDPENTVTRVRQVRSAEDQITSVQGSTRLEAKKQRRREGREAGRRRAPIVSEAEFLARREAVDRVMVVRQRKDLTQIAVLEDKVLVEHYVARESQTSLIGNVYLGRVQNVLPSMEAAFIDIGKGRNAVLYAGEVNWSALGHKDGQPRKIENVLSSGQTVLVQVTKDPIGHKGARLTSQVSLAGRFLVYVPDGTTSGISRKLPDTERARLKALLKEIVPDTAGVIVRTAAEGAAEDELTRDVERLKARWEEIERQTQGDAKGNAPRLLYGEPDLTLKVVRDLFTEDFGKLVIQGEDAWDTVQQYVAHVAPDLEDRLEKYSGDDVFASYRVTEQIQKGLDRKVWLPSGGSLIIDRTEAMTVVDVNTGKFTGSGGNLEETVTKNNLEAAEEVVRQLRLRDIGGIIVVDFIDMVLESNRDLVLRRLVECLGRDRTRHQVAEVTSLGLVQMTRKRIGTGLLEAFSETCEHCHGTGHLTHDMPIEQKRTDDGGARGGNNRRGRGRGQGGQEQAAATPSPKDVAAIAHAPELTDTDVAAIESAEAPDVAELDVVEVAPAETVETPTVDESPAALREVAAVPEFLEGEPDLREQRLQRLAEEAAEAERKAAEEAAEAERRAIEAAERKAARDAERQAQREARAAARAAEAAAAAEQAALEQEQGEQAPAADETEATPEAAVEAPADEAVETDETPVDVQDDVKESPQDAVVAAPAAPVATTTVVTRERRAVRRVAGSTAGAAPEPVTVVVAPVVVEPAAATEPPRVVTRTRRAATRAAGSGGVVEAAPVVPAATDAPGEAPAESELHVPVKKKGTRKR